MSVATGTLSTALFATVFRAPTRIISASCSLLITILKFLITTVFVKMFLKTIRNKKKKHNKVAMLARSKLNNIESKISEALINNEISHKTV